jgi:hypothetical protein
MPNMDPGELSPLKLTIIIVAAAVVFLMALPMPF